MARVRPRWRRDKPKEPNIENNRTRLRLGLVRLVLLALFAILVVQLYKLQIAAPDYYRIRADNNRLRIVTIPPNRGIVIARNGEILVRNIPSFSVQIIPADLPQDQQEIVAVRLARLLNSDSTTSKSGYPAVNVPTITAADILAAVQQQRAKRLIFDEGGLKSDVSEDMAMRIEEAHDQLPGVSVRAEALREYTGGIELSHLLGYMGRINAEEYAQLKSKGYGLSDRLGKAGIEASYEAELRGQNGIRQEIVDVTGRQVAELESIPPQPGNILRLSIDVALQAKVAEILQAQMVRSKQAVAIVGNPQTGEIYAMVSLPTFDNNIFTRGISEVEWNRLLADKRYPLINHAIGSAIPPGSIFKLIPASAALQEGIISPNTTIRSTGTLIVKNDFDENIQYIFRDTAAGDFDLYHALAMSSNTYFYYLAGGYAEAGFRGLGLDRLVRYAHQFGLGAPTGVDLPGEVNGLVPNDAWKRRTWREGWLLGDTYNFGIGQGFVLVTPIQMWNVVSAVANGGTLYQPRIVRDILDDRGNLLVPFTPRVIGHVGVDNANLEHVRLGMREAVLSGTARAANQPGLSLAAKTGTAEYGERDPTTGQYANSHAWFIGFAPFENPTIAIVVYLDAGIGSSDATPTATRILQYLFRERQDLIR